MNFDTYKIAFYSSVATIIFAVLAFIAGMYLIFGPGIESINNILPVISIISSFLYFGVLFGLLKLGKLYDKKYFVYVIYIITFIL